MKDYKPLLSTAPAHSILNAQGFRYTNSAATNIRETFARIRQRRAKANAVTANVGDNVRSFHRRNGTSSD